MSPQNVEVVAASLGVGSAATFGVWRTRSIRNSSSFSNAEGVGLAGQWRGIDELSDLFREFLRDLADYRLESEQIIELDDGQVFVLGRDRVVGRASGAPIEMETAFLFTLRDGHIVRWDAYTNREEARKAVGLEA